MITIKLYDIVNYFNYKNVIRNDYNLDKNNSYQKIVYIS